jgi:hypothetical protein
MSAVTTSNQIALYPHGIFQEDSDIRVHVAPGTRAIYVFQTARAIEAIQAGDYKLVTASQPGVAGPTAAGYAIPCKAIRGMRRITIDGGPWWECFAATDSTSLKGTKAVEVVKILLATGRLPLWVVEPANDSRDVKVQIKGTDIVCWGKWKIQVKCDWRAGDGGSGNVFLQTAERNPLRRY